MKTGLLVIFLIVAISSQQLSELCFRSCSSQLRQVCVGNKRFWNQCVARCSLGVAVQISECSRDNIRDTITPEGNTCYCNLLVEPTCFKDNIRGQYLNPCFAHCAYPKSSYKDYENCKISDSDFAVSQLYVQNKTCSCNNVYAPTCISGYQFSSVCYANCYQPDKQTSSCENIFRFLTSPKKDNADCVCINSLNPVCVGKTRYANPCLAACDFPDIIAYSC